MDTLDRLGPLGDPTRRALYRVVVDSAEPVSRDAAAAALGITRSLAAFHLDRLVEAELLTVEYRRLSGRSGPGAGRPSKLYLPAADGLELSVPPRRYDVIAGLLAAGVDAAADGDGSAGATRAAIDGAAADMGRSLGATARRAAGRRPTPTGLKSALLETLGAAGFRPRVEPEGTILLANCPFDAVARDHRPTVCRANLALVSGLMDALGPETPVTAELEPADGRCCVVLRPTAPPLD
ncbi:MAG TPA: helix-turn-helix domain-containing protein [Candidatus Limnocylindrales bacterium]|nr:helix-turn-helix domain-containing protein [Candidatus Limnocylindrales bacterium]